MNRTSFKLLLALLLVALFSTAGFATDKFALVIGNANYAVGSALRNPVNDAQDMARTLQSLGFKVDLLTDASLDAMETSVVKLGENVSKSKDSIGLFYYAGHGVQSSGNNYLIPVDTDIKSEAFLRTKALQAQTVLDQLTQAKNQLNIVILDACRDNPFSFSRSASRGLAAVSSQPAGSIVVYATSAGQTAQDGTGRNGLFTQSLLKNLATPGLEVSQVFKQTGADVLAASNNSQVPAVYTQFFGSAYLNGQSTTASQPTVQPAPAATSPAPAKVAPVAEQSTVKRDYKVGDTGPAGGIIFFDKGNNKEGWRYLEVAPKDIGTGSTWDNSLPNTISTGESVGSGVENTSSIISALGSGNYAALAASSHSQGGAKDWYLPTTDELALAYNSLTKVGLGNFKSKPYWSSSSYNSSYARFFDFSKGVKDYDSKSKVYLVRPIRQVSENGSSVAAVVDSKTTNWSTSVFKVGETGPAGGIIFYDKGTNKDGWRYLEVAPNDIGTGSSWDNSLPNSVITSETLGSGAENASSIISALGSGNYAALAASNYTQGGEKDWYLPSTDELALAYNSLTKVGLGNFKSKSYWSSSSYNSSYARFFDFSKGVKDYDSKSKVYLVRPIRQVSENGSSVASVVDTKTTNWSTSVIKVGDTGPAGGIIFYDKGNNKDGWRYLEVAPNDIGIGSTWDNSLPNAVSTSESLGSGAENTSSIISGLGSGNYAAFAASNHTQGGAKDWYLPSTDELALAYNSLTKVGLGNFKSKSYWSSSSYNASYARFFDFSKGVKDYDSKSKVYFVRPIRQVSENGSSVASVVDSKTTNWSTSDIKVGDTGPAGGIIFYDKGNNKDGWRYLEVARNDIGSGSTWDNGLPNSVSTGESIGFGAENTLSIISALGSGNYAAMAASNNSQGGAKDWYLPTTDELALAYNSLTKVGLGNFKSKPYWSSSSYNSSYARFFDFSKGVEDYDSKSKVYLVRTVRKF